jgi:hypothetical protein
MAYSLLLQRVIENALTTNQRELRNLLTMAARQSRGRKDDPSRPPHAPKFQ